MQLELYLKGERDYALITGPTGPIVYVTLILRAEVMSMLSFLQR